MTTPAKTLEHSAVMLMEKIVDPDNRVRASTKCDPTAEPQAPTGSRSTNAETHRSLPASGSDGRY
jgi:hypothetical protein